MNYEADAIRLIDIDQFRTGRTGYELFNNCSRPISIARRNLTVPCSIPRTICPCRETIYFHLRRPVVKALGGKNWPSSIKLTFPRHDQEVCAAVLHVGGYRYIP
jgi:hypothetical protein